MLTLITTAPDGTETRTGPIAHGPAVILAVARTLEQAAPWLTATETRRLGMHVARTALGITSVHGATGYRFRVDSAVQVAAS